MTVSQTSPQEARAREPVPAGARGARVFPIPPPVYYGAAFASAMVLQRAVPLDMPGRPASALVGTAVLLVGLGMDLTGVATVLLNRTTIVPHRPVAKLITTGIYRLSRNPMYTGLAIMVAGGALVAGTWWPLLTLPLALLAVRQLAIEPEETYLAERYGPTYEDYRRRVRRWL